jgi:hypothetical protein
MARRTKKKGGLPGSLVAVVLIGVIAAGAVYVYRNSAPVDPPYVDQLEQPGAPYVGDRVVVSRFNEEYVDLCEDLETVAKLRVVIAKRSTGEFRQMLDSGKVSAVPKGTEAVVIDVDRASRKVRFEGGPWAGKVGWLFREDMMEKAK